MRILLYTDDFLTRSMTFIYNPLQLLRQHHQVFVACLQQLNADLFPAEDVFVVPTGSRDRRFVNRMLRKLGLSFIRRDARFERSLYEYAGPKQPDLVHAHFGPCGIRVYPISRRLGVPLLITFHGFDASHLLRRHPYVRALRRMFDDPNVYGIAVSSGMRDNLAGYGVDAGRILPLHPGIDTSFFDPSGVDGPEEAGAFVFLQVANFVEKKGQRYAVMAFAELLRHYSTGSAREPSLVLAGDGPLRKQIEELVDRLGIGDRVRFIGPVDRVEVRQLMAGADVFVHHSVTGANGDQEGLPSALLEAMAMGLPVLSTWHSGIPELVRDGVDGILVRERDVRALSEPMRLACEGKMDWHRPELSRRRVVENFDLPTQTARLMELYERAARNSNGDRRERKGVL